MVDMNQYMKLLIAALKETFGYRLIYVGLQGSYLRGEATAESDIDIMTVIDDLSIKDLAAYRSVVKSLPGADLSCGFICSKDDLKHWNRLESYHCLNSTRDYYGTLHKLLPDFSQEDIRTFLKVSINNLYHALCHTYVHEGTDKVAKALPGLYKQTFFILQGLHGLQSGVFVNSKYELVNALSGINRNILERNIQMGAGTAFDDSESFELLFTWCRKTMKEL